MSTAGSQETRADTDQTVKSLHYKSRLCTKLKSIECLSDLYLFMRLLSLAWYGNTCRTPTYTRPVGTFGHAVGAQVDAGVATPCVFTLLIWAANPLSALVYIWGEKRENRGGMFKRSHELGTGHSLEQTLQYKCFQYEHAFIDLEKLDLTRGGDISKCLSQMKDGLDWQARYYGPHMP